MHSSFGEYCSSDTRKKTLTSQGGSYTYGSFVVITPHRLFGLVMPDYVRLRLISARSFARCSRQTDMQEEWNYITT